MSMPIDELVPRTPTFLALALVFAATVVFGGELFAATRGIEAPIATGPIHWAQTYEDALEATNPILVVGSSRTLYGVEPAVLSEALDRPVFDLAINGGNPIPIVEHLIADGYVGDLLVGYMPSRISGPDAYGHEVITPYLDALDRNLSQEIEHELSAFVGGLFRTRSEQLQFLNVLKSLSRGSFPEASFRHRRPDRYEFVEQNRIPQADLERMEAKFLDVRLPFETEEEQNEARNQACELDQTFSESGGRIFWVRFPMHGALRAREAELYPRQDYYDHFCVERKLHFDSLEDNIRLETFDTSHLNPESAVRMTNAIATWIESATSR